jgi:AraC-like DNA-binding protein
MGAGNICRFAPLYPAADVIQTINFVMETKPQRFDKLKINSVYRVYYVTQGKGILHLAGDSRHLCPGDLFFIQPSVQHAIESIGELHYMYISYIGIRANQLMERAGVTYSSFFFSGLDELRHPWQYAIKNAVSENTDLISESLLLYSFSVLIGRNADAKKQSAASKSKELAMQIKKYVEDNFSDSGLNLKKISQEFSYNPKYLSALFKQHLGVGLFNYISIVRCKHACMLMEQNFTCIKDIAYLCGFADPLYFSRVFKQKIGLAPRDYLKNRHRNFTGT